MTENPYEIPAEIRELTEKSIEEAARPSKVSSRPLQSEYVKAQLAAMQGYAKEIGSSVLKAVTPYK